MLAPMPSRFALILLPLLAACADGGGDYPGLLPLEEVLPAPLPAHAAGTTPDAVAAALRGQAASLDARAEATRSTPAADPALDARAKALRARADALRAADG